MKHGIFRAVFLVGLACAATFSLYGQNSRPATMSTVVLEAFNGDNTHQWHDGRYLRTFEFSWDVRASAAATTASVNGSAMSFPRMTYVEAWPSALFSHNRGGAPLQSFGVNGRFDRRGNNWVDIFPVGANGQPFEIPMPGRVHGMDMWVWGSNLHYNLEAYVRDAQGTVHRIQLGSLAFPGWKNMAASIPRHISQDSRVIPAHAQLHFVKFRIWTMPNERVDNFYVYFNRFQILTDVYEPYFDGGDLADPDFVADIWNN